ncbi:MAG TPA: hypothetical protein VJN01_06670, partial [Xanthomonadales bacterium]|nr:hypothetical protein [Xanthomonadales bacterium]
MLAIGIQVGSKAASYNLVHPCPDMLVDFYYALRDGGLKVSVTEYLALLEALKSGLADYSL